MFLILILLIIIIIIILALIYFVISNNKDFWHCPSFLSLSISSDITLAPAITDEQFCLSENNVTINPRIIMVSGSIGKREFAKISKRRLENYCKKHGYDLFYFEDYIDKNYYVMWQKILALKKVLSEGHHDYAMWIDDDIYITNMDIKVEHFISSSSSLRESNKDDIILSRDVKETANLYLNSGTMIIKNSTIGKEFLNKVLSGYMLFGGYFQENLYHEQTIMTYFYFKEYINKATVLPHRVMQSFFRGKIWQIDDFGLHFAGYSADTRERCMKLLDNKDDICISDFYSICNPELST